MGRISSLIYLRVSSLFSNSTQLSLSVFVITVYHTILIDNKRVFVLFW